MALRAKKRRASDRVKLILFADLGAIIKVGVQVAAFK